MSVKPDKIEVYCLGDAEDIHIFSVEVNSDDGEVAEVDIVHLFLENFSEEIPCTVTVEFYSQSYLLKFKDIDLEIDIKKCCKLKEFEAEDDLCRLCMANFVLEEMLTIC
jgi:hypothetical protein